MPIENEPFIRTKLDDEERQDTFTVKLNREERLLFEKIKDALHEDKDGTAIKQAAFLVAVKVIFDPVNHQLMDLAVNNYRRGRERGRVRNIDA